MQQEAACTSNMEDRNEKMKEEKSKIVITPERVDTLRSEMKKAIGRQTIIGQLQT